MKHISIAKQSLVAQSLAIEQMAKKLDGQFEEAVEAILECKGRVIISGMGKSGIIGKKMAATFASTGTPSFFMHPGEAFHGDLGMITPHDLVILLSYSGETEEVLRLIPSLESFGNRIIAMTGEEKSSLSQHSEIFLDVGVEREVCPNNLAPTTSTLATMAMGDALAVALIQARGFQPLDFARYHPGGSLGRKLLTRVKDEMHRAVPSVSQETSLQECLIAMTTGRIGMVAVIDDGVLHGLITDGDIRRGLLSNLGWECSKAKDLMTEKPHSIHEEALIAEAEELMHSHKIKALLVKNVDGDVVGVLEIF
ncbi:SIS domain-containing protein [Halomonas sp. DN3]|uniref:KpsF/GutQ family sugar-phosphate isomerase n=1 Tax=Halomonas sp. DN3 TaxID=2953657 RepID=UPI00209D80EB|nr:KpsF/GutQ family sugar-phosphate isomerase [Halomonas sp. DN3]USZ51565.1 KpsF/GutQ family sugar-phosphate isomerase [Halomonas sp. DN3]